MKRILPCALLACAMATASTARADRPECSDVSTSVKKLVTAKPHDLLAIVERQVATHPSCACEIVKASIIATEAYPDLVGQIVAAAVGAAPDKLRVITTCAIAVAPDAVTQIKAIIAKIDPKQDTTWKLGIGAKSGPAKAPTKDPGPGAKDALGAKDAKDAMAVSPARARNPLDGPYLLPDFPPLHPPMLNSTCTPDQFPNVQIINP